ncbi:MAG: futalosine hydrolase [Dissulfurispiraceae bacterium]
MIGIIASTRLEAELMIKQFKRTEEICIQHKMFYTGLFGKHTPAAICICGVGKTNASHGATIFIERFDLDILFNIGVAGAYPSSGLLIGDVAIAEKEIYGDEGLKIKNGFYTMSALNLPLVSLPHTRYFNEFPMSIPEGLGDLPHRGNFITVSTCTGTAEEAKERSEQFNALCENMEGAAVAHVCLLNGVPVSELRGISNIIVDRELGPLNKSDILSAAESVQRVLLETLL